MWLYIPIYADQDQQCASKTK